MNNQEAAANMFEECSFIRIYYDRLSSSAKNPVFLRNSVTTLRLYSARNKLILPGKTERIELDIAIHLPVCVYGRIKSDPHLVMFHKVYAEPSAIDDSNPVCVTLTNDSTDNFQVTKGSSVALIKFQHIYRPRLSHV